jgi:pimeloyl-ACP methyl ester carboxylesterase
MAERVVQANGVDIWTEDFGDRSSPTILLVMGAGGQAILWPDEFIDGLVAGGKHVIRYDNRDVGQTTCFDFEKNPYTIADMAGDAIAILDAYQVDRADVVGASMGGMIVQTMALNAPDRVRTMTSIMSSPLAGGFMNAVMGGGESSLPGPEQKVIDLMALNAEPATSDEERIDRAVVQWRTLAGTMAPFDEDEVRERDHGDSAGVIEDRADHDRNRRRRQLVAHVLDGQELGPRDGLGRRLAVCVRKNRIARAVDDERRRRNSRQIVDPIR